MKQPKWLWGSFDEAMKRWSSAQLLRATEFVYAIVTLFALTQGPVYRLWSDSASEIDRLPSPTIPHTYFATFVLVQLPALVLLSRRLDRSWVRNRANLFLTVLVAWLVLSVFWSTFSRLTLPEVVSLTLTTVFGLYLAESFPPRQFWAVVASAMTLGVSLSWLAVMRLWEGAVNFQEDYWIGIYYNRNSLAPVTAVAIIASFGGVISTWEAVRTDRRFLPAFALIGGLTLSTFAGIELWQSESQTSPIALIIALGTTALWMVTRWGLSRSSTLSWMRPFAASIAVLIAGVILFIALQVVGGFGGVSSEVATLNSRRNLWSLSWAGIQEKPWFGWGWMAAWQTDEFFGESSSWLTWGSLWSHNGYHDVLLGGGSIAGVLFLGYLWFATRSFSQYPVQFTAPRLTLAGFALVASTQESFFIGSHFVWALLVAALAPIRAVSRLGEGPTRTS